MRKSGSTGHVKNINKMYYYGCIDYIESLERYNAKSDY